MSKVVFCLGEFLILLVFVHIELVCFDSYCCEVSDQFQLVQLPKCIGYYVDYAQLCPADLAITMGRVWGEQFCGKNTQIVGIVTFT